MGVISVEQTDRLFWLGRYTERVYTTISLFSARVDRMIDGEPGGYVDFCRHLEIPDIYTSDEDFQEKYAFDTENPDSIISNLNRAYDNAIVLRESIGSEALSYIQLCIYAINRAQKSSAPLLELQKVKDNILAFWGIADDMIESENIRNIIKVGKRVERIALLGRLRQNKKDMLREIHRLSGRINRCSISYHKEKLDQLKSLTESQELDCHQIVVTVESLLK